MLVLVSSPQVHHQYYRTSASRQSDRCSPNGSLQVIGSLPTQQSWGLLVVCRYLFYKTYIYPVTVQPLAVAMLISEVAAPQLLLIVIVCPTTVARLVNISFNLSADSLQLAYEIVAFVPASAPADSERQVLNVLVKLVPKAVLNNGTDCREKQLPNITKKLVHNEVLNNGTDCKELQFWNI